MDGLIALLADIDAAASWAQEPSTLVADLIDEVLERNGGAPLDDIAAILLDGWPGRRLMRAEPVQRGDVARAQRRRAGGGDAWSRSAPP